MKKTTLFWLISGVILLFNFVIYSTHWGGDTFLLIVSDFLPVLCSFLAMSSLYIAFKAFKEFDFTKLTWFLMLIGMIFYFLAESTYAILEIFLKMDMNETFPSYADFFWCIGYIPFFIGLTMMFFGYKNSGLPMGNIKVISLISFLIIILASAVIYYLLIPVITDPETGILTKIFSLYYPIADVLVVIPAVILIYITSLFGKATISRPWQYMAIGFTFNAIADILYSYLSWKDLYGNGNFIDVVWHAGYLLIGLSGVYQWTLIESLKERVKQ